MLLPVERQSSYDSSGFNAIGDLLRWSDSVSSRGSRRHLPATILQLGFIKQLKPCAALPERTDSVSVSSIGFSMLMVQPGTT
ncbi:hypothetical protein ACNKHU_02055 [Shigella flexneri]